MGLSGCGMAWRHRAGVDCAAIEPVTSPPPMPRPRMEQPASDADRQRQAGERGDPKRLAGNAITHQSNSYASYSMA